MTTPIIETARVLSSIVASQNIESDIKKEAERSLSKLLNLLDKSIDLETKMMTEASARMNGIIQ